MRIRKTPAEWEAIIAEQQASGLSIPQFCSDKHIHPNVFYRKRKEMSTWTKAFIKLPVKICSDMAFETIRIGSITIEVKTSISDAFFVRLIRCAMEANDVHVSR
jgi:hypothetical protein